MIHRLAAAAGLLALSTSLALAQTATSTPAEPASKADANLKEWQVAKVAKVGLAQALTTAEGQGEEKGGRAIDADFEKADSKDPAHYSVKVVYPSGKLVEYGINADTGVLYKTENQPFERYFTRLKACRLPERQDLAEGRARHRRAEGRRRQGLRGRGREGRRLGPVRDQGGRRRQGAGGQGRTGRQGPELRPRAAAAQAAASPSVPAGGAQR